MGSNGSPALDFWPSDRIVPSSCNHYFWFQQESFVENPFQKNSEKSYLKSRRFKKLDDGVPDWLLDDLIGLTLGDFSIRTGMGEKLKRCFDPLLRGRTFAISSDMFKAPGEFFEWDVFEQFNPKLVFIDIFGETKNFQRILNSIEMLDTFYTFQLTPIDISDRF